MLSKQIPQLKRWSLAKKQQLIEELIDEVYGEPVNEPEVVTALDARLKHFETHPQSATSWAEAAARRRTKK